MSNTSGVYGAGAWGSALALTAARAGAEVILCGRSSEEAETLNATRRSSHLPDAVNAVFFHVQDPPQKPLGDFPGDKFGLLS